jgi:cyclopropane fatty-acyl-phospholipid synthase-like methyltransferase
MNRIQKPYAASCDENRDPILEVIAPLLADVRKVLEIGSGTGQHAVYFAGRMPHLTWQTSDVAQAHQGIRLWIEDAGVRNVLPPLALDVAGAWPEGAWEAIFSANTVHIMSWPAVEAMFRGVAAALLPGGRFLLYGPLNYAGRYTSESNARFDAWLKDRDPRSGVRNFEDLDSLARDHGMTLVRDYAMPVNNRLLHWQRAV